MDLKKMNLVFFVHPSFLSLQSMSRFAKMLADGMTERGHAVALWSPKARFFQLHSNKVLRKWLGYIDQFVVFPREARRLIKGCPPDTLFVFADQALGAWVPLVSHLPHVIHCHDFLALSSALGEIPENPTSWTGRQYQQLIRRGFSKGRNFISVSQKTQQNLHELLPPGDYRSEVVYNGLNQSFAPQDREQARILLGNKVRIELTTGYLLHVGGNQWYKNRYGIIEIYDAWRSMDTSNLPLLFIGEPPTKDLSSRREKSAWGSDIYFLSGLEDKFLRVAYSGASVFLFPSLAEGFGWPIAEAMASGCPVITTDEAPMTEVAGNAGFLIKKRPQNDSMISIWAKHAAETISKVIRLSAEDRKAVVLAGLKNAKRFDPDVALDQIELIYKRILNENPEK